jgi:hypothetical protein
VGPLGQTEEVRAPRNKVQTWDILVSETGNGWGGFCLRGAAWEVFCRRCQAAFFFFFLSLRDIGEREEGELQSIVTEYRDLNLL